MDLGTDVLIMDDYQKSSKGDLQTITDILNLREAIYRRVFTTPGEVLHRPKYGIGLKRFLNKPCTETNKQELINLVKLNLPAEKRIETVEQVLCDWSSDVLNLIIKVTAYGRIIQFDYEVVKV